MTLDIFFDRYLLTLHAIVVALGLIVYVGVARALPQRRDPSAAIAWVVALALLPYVALPLYFMFGSRKLRMRDAPPLALPPVATARPTTTRRPRSGRAASAARWAWRRPPATADLRIHADGARGARRRARADRRRDPDASTSAPSSSPATASATRSPRRCAAQAERGVKVRLLIDGIGAWLGGRLDMQALQPLRRRGRQVRAAVPLDPARPRQPAQPPQDDRRRRRAALVRRPQLRRRVLRGRSGEARRQRCATRLARPQLRPARRARRPRRRAVREGLGLRDPRSRSPRPVPGAARSSPRRRAARAARAERPRAGRRHRAVAARLGLLHGARRILVGHALLHSRRDPADGADAGGAPRRADRHRPAAPLEPPPRRRRPAPAAARPRRRRRAALVRRRSCCTPRRSSSTTSSRWSARPTSTCAASSSTTS